MKTDKLDAIVERFKALDLKVQDPAVIADNKAWAELCRERSELEPIVEKYGELKKAKADYADALEMQKSDDAEMVALAKEECDSLSDSMERITDELKVMLLPKDPNDGKNAVLEIRPAAGGEEAALFAAELSRMYRMFAERKRWTVEDISINQTELGGIKEAVFGISGKDVFEHYQAVNNVRGVSRRVKVCLSDLLTELSAIRMIIEDEANDEQ